MYSFEGDFRRKPIQSLRGASKQEHKESLLRRNQAERQKREDKRLQHTSAIKIQAFFRGYHARQAEIKEIRCNFDRKVEQLLKLSKLPPSSLTDLIRQLLFFYKSSVDDDRLKWLCQYFLKQKEEFVRNLCQEFEKNFHQLCRLLELCLRCLVQNASRTVNITVPLRMLEEFTSAATYRGAESSLGRTGDVLVKSLLDYLVQNGYYRCMRRLINHRVPASIERSSTFHAPTPAADSIFELIMKPISFATSSHDKKFSHEILTEVCKSLLCPAYTEQIGQWLIPAMAYGKYPFPFVELIQTLIIQTSGKCSRELNIKQRKSNTVKREPGRSRRQDRVESTPWLLGAVLSFSEKYLDTVGPGDCVALIAVLHDLVPLLPYPVHGDDYDSDSESEEDLMIIDEAVEGCSTSAMLSDSEERMVGDNQTGVRESLSQLRSECMRILDSPRLVKCVISAVSRSSSAELLTAVCAVCHSLMAKQRLPVHKSRMLYTLAFNTSFIRQLWFCCASISAPTATGSQISFIQMLSRGLPMTDSDTRRIIPLLSVFCSLFSHSLQTLHDSDFYGEEQEIGTSSSMPFSLDELVPMSLALRDACLGIVELAYPDSHFSFNQDYKSSLQRTGVRMVTHGTDHLQQEVTWAYVFKITANLVNQLFARDARRQFCPRNHWLAKHIHIQADKPSQIYSAQHAVFVRRPFRTLKSLTKTEQADEGPPLSNKEVRKLVVLTELPYVVSFQERVKILQRLIMKDREEHQNDLSQFVPGQAINVTIRRNYIYEDAFEKLSPQNEPNLKLKMRVHLVNVAGMDEAGIDGGGLFREFLSQLLKTAFDPNRGFFKHTVDQLLYPNPQAQVLNEDYTDHFYFVGRMLGKALYENMLVELPFASFFLSKLLSRSSGNLDIHHLHSMDPIMYKNLLFLKTYQGDVSDLGLDFTVVNNNFGETQIEELKPGGQTINVTDHNMIEYIHLMADYMLNKQIRSHCNAFRRGMADVINLEWLRMFDHHELQVLVSGASVPVDIEDLRQHTNYSGGYAADHPVIDLFWKVVSNFTDQQKRKLLKFVTSCSRPPLLGFKDLYPAFCIHYAGDNVDRLPTASTCMNLLKLPEFRDEAIMMNKLKYAVESDSGFELS